MNNSSGRGNLFWEIFFVDQFTYLQKKKRPVAFTVSNTKQRQVFPHGYFNRHRAEFGEIRQIV